MRNSGVTECCGLAGYADVTRAVAPLAAMSKPSLWSDEQRGHSWLPAAEPTAPEFAPPAPAAPTEEHRRRRPKAPRIGFPTLMIVACVAGAAAGALAEMLR